MAEPAEVKTSINPDLANELVRNSVAYTNVGQYLITTTADRIRLCLKDYERAVKNRSQWTTPFTTLITFIATLVAAEFRPFFGVSAENWKVLFIAGAVVSAFFLVRNVILLLRDHGRAEIDWVIKQIKEYRS